MKTKIKQIEVVKSVGFPQIFCVGTSYNGLLLDKIVDHSSEFPDSIFSLYSGYTKDKELIFELVNAPVVVELEPEEASHD